MAKPCGVCGGSGKLRFGLGEITCPRCLGRGTTGSES